jgi:hypothetical protein
MLLEGRGSSYGWALGRRVVRCAVVAMLAALAAGGPAAPRAGAIFRAFEPLSPWNQTAVAVGQSNPWAAQLTNHPGLPLRMSGTPDNPTYSAPVFFAQRGDPVAPVFVTQPGWLPKGDTEWSGRPIPVPSGVRPAAGGDGHLAVVSADRRTAWDFFGCTVAGPDGYVTRVIAQWDLTGPGYSMQANETSARGSGTPLISTSLRAEEAIKGFQHALGISVPQVSSDYIGPATHSDGGQGPGAIKYGMRFVLRPDYAVPPDASLGVVNVIYALKVYGLLVVDQGADIEMDADFTHPGLWQQAGLEAKAFDFTAADLRPAVPGTPPPLPTIVSPVRQSSVSNRVSLHGNRKAVRVGRRVHLYGKVRADLVGDERVRLEAFARGRWRDLKSVPVRTNRTFSTTATLYASVRGARGGRPATALKIRRLHLGSGTRLQIRAIVPDIGRSPTVAVRLAR